MDFPVWRPAFTPLIFVAVTLSACGGASTALTPSAPSGGRGVDGSTVSAVDGSPIGGVSVQIGSRASASDAGGSFHLENVAGGDQPAIFSGPLVVERHTTVSGLSSGSLRESLIPASFDLTAFDQMFRGTGALQRWMNPPRLVLLTTVMNYEVGFGDLTDFHATSEQLTADETAEMLDHLTGDLAVLHGHNFTSFASVELESEAAGAKVSTLRPGKIVLGRYKGLQSLGNTIGYGRWATDGASTITGGAVYLDRDFDKTSDLRRLLRTHELGHALGLTHVTSTASIMNPSIGPDVQLSDRQSAIVAFERQPGNVAPDTDPTGGPKQTGSGGLFGIAPAAGQALPTSYWSSPIN